MKHDHILTAVLLLSLSAVSFALTNETSPEPQYFFSLGSYIGGGTVSSDETVKNSGGYGITFEREWFLGHDFGNLVVGPRLEAVNSFVNTRAERQGSSFVYNYDNRIIAAGIHLGRFFGSSPDMSTPSTSLVREIYINAMAGKSYSKLTIDENAERRYVQHYYNGIQGDYFAGELGVMIPIRAGFYCNVAAMNSSYKAHQKDATGTYEESNVVDAEKPQGGYSLRTVDGVHSDARLLNADTLYQKTFGLKVSVSIGW